LVFIESQTTFDHADSTLEFVAGDAFHTGASVVFEAAILHELAAAGLSDEVAALAGDATEVIVGFAVGDAALVVLQLEGIEAVGASVVDLLLPASQHEIVLAVSEDQRVFVFALAAASVSVVCCAKFDSLLASSICLNEPICAI